MNTGQLLKMHNSIFRLYRENEHLMYEMSSEAITCKNRQEFVKYLKNFKFEDTCIVVSTECFDDSLERFREGSGKICMRYMLTEPR